MWGEGYIPSPLVLRWVIKLTIAEKEKKWEKEKEILIREQRLEAEKAKYKKKLTMQKKILIYITINCTIVQIYAMVVMFLLRDLSALYALITAVIGEAFSFFIYEYKTTKENSTENGTTVLAMKRQYELEDRESSPLEPGPREE